MSRYVRPLRRDDLDRLAVLFAETFRREQDADLASLVARLERAYFDHPWADLQIPSRVYDDGRQLVGFLGVVPRPMQFGDRRVVAAITGNLMVRPGKAGAFVSLQLSRACLRGPQDLTISDSGLDSTRRIAERSGGITARLYSLRFDRRIAPLSHAGHELLRWRAPALWRRLSPLLSQAERRVSQRLFHGPYRRYDNGHRTEPIEIDALAQRLSRQPEAALRPVYEPSALAWMLQTPRRPGGAGMRIRRVVDPHGREVGVFAYYLEPGEAGDVVLVVGSQPRAVLECLIDDAVDGGARSLWGRADPQQLLDLTTCGCQLGSDSWVLVHANDPALLQPFLRGDAFFPPLDGERWSMRFVDQPLGEP